MSEVVVELPDADAARAFGRALAGVLGAGDLVVLTGPLGAGKTTLTQGVGEGMGVRGQVASPTFIIARVHPPSGDGPALVHVDAYRLGSLEELDALDLDTSLEDSVTVVEWGEGLAEVLSDDRLEVVIERPHGAGPTVGAGGSDGGSDGGAGPGADGSGGAAGPGADALGALDALDADAGPRRVTLRPVGDRWTGVPLPTSWEG